MNGIKTTMLLAALTAAGEFIGAKVRRSPGPKVAFTVSESDGP